MLPFLITGNPESKKYHRTRAVIEKAVDLGYLLAFFRLAGFRAFGAGLVGAGFGAGSGLARSAPRTLAMPRERHRSSIAAREIWPLEWVQQIT